MEDLACGQWLGFHPSNTVGMSLIPGPVTKIPHALQYSQKEKEKKRYWHLKYIKNS